MGYHPILIAWFQSYVFYIFRIRRYWVDPCAPESNRNAFAKHLSILSLHSIMVNIFLSFAMDTRTRLIEPRPQNNILSQKNQSVLESLDLQVFRLEIHSVCNSTLCLYSSSEKDKRPAATNFEQWQRGSSESRVSIIIFYYIWGNDPRCGCILWQGDSLRQYVLTF